MRCGFTAHFCFALAVASPRLDLAASCRGFALEFSRCRFTCSFRIDAFLLERRRHCLEASHHRLLAASNYFFASRFRVAISTLAACNFAARSSRRGFFCGGRASYFLIETTRCESEQFCCSLLLQLFVPILRRRFCSALPFRFFASGLRAVR